MTRLCHDKDNVWKLSYRLWNSCVDLSNAAAVHSSPSDSDYRNITDEQHAFIQHVAADVTGIPSPAFKIASFFHKTGLIWHDLGEFELASTCFKKATDLTSKIEISVISGDKERKLLLDLSIARSRTVWEVQDQNLAVNLLNRSKSVLFGCAANYKQLANQYMIFGKTVLSKNETSSVNEALKLMNEALDLCEKGLRIVKRESETLRLKELRSRTLRFIAASHLQKDEFESVLKCVRVLREGAQDDKKDNNIFFLDNGSENKNVIGLIS
ncbi:hypothetical protein RJ639_022323 [Escallonia herrerae]|uniref:Protein ZIP4 homolog n=1 Tax=Escallonia herrerae TaxID=1293975 RepID=A0AA88V4Z8_9ASTE|nr:hypothetical protein RJ639_022323 [Escallonia herrerae]